MGIFFTLDWPEILLAFHWMQPTLLKFKIRCTHLLKLTYISMTTAKNVNLFLQLFNNSSLFSLLGREEMKGLVD